MKAIAIRKKMSYPYDKAVMQKGKAWGKMPVPSLWENNVLPGFDGIVVMQFELDLPATAAGKPLQLCLGAVDDWDMTYFNGKLVGSGRIFDQQRDYRVDGNLVKGGKNVITVEVIDNAGEVVYGNPPVLSLTEQGIALTGNGAMQCFLTSHKWTWLISCRILHIIRRCYIMP